MTAHDLEAKQADVALDPMAGCEIARRVQLGLDAHDRPTGNSMAEVVASLDPNPWAADEQEFVEQVRAAKPNQPIFAPKGMTMERAAYLSNLARAHVSATSSGLGKINIEPADPWARGGHEIAPNASPRRTDAGSTVATSPGIKVTILALDLGTKTGYALRRRDGTLRYGTEVFTPRASWTPGQKWQRYRAWLSKTIVEEAVDLIVFEDVKAHGKGAVLAAHAYGGFRAMLEMVADGHRVRLLPVGVGTIKKHWTGKGNANKDAMLAQAKARGFRPETDNDADALAILHWAVEQEASR